MLQFKTLTHASVRLLTETFNAAFSDYLFPLRFTEQQFEEKFATEGVRLDLSVGAYDEDRLVAFIFHFVNVKNSTIYLYNGGTGVLPSYRGNGLTSKMYAFIKPRLQAAGIKHMVLEVLTENAPAIEVYKKQGFAIRRSMWCFAGRITRLPSKKNAESTRIVELKEADWGKLQTFWDAAPAWQNSIATLTRMLDKIVVFGLHSEQELVGYLVYNPTRKRIHQLAVAKTHRNRGFGESLLQHLATIENESVSMINVDSSLVGFKKLLEKSGLVTTVSQYEMCVELLSTCF